MKEKERRRDIIVKRLNEKSHIVVKELSEGKGHIVVKAKCIKRERVLLPLYY
jgi:hypothetical protein